MRKKAVSKRKSMHKESCTSAALGGAGSLDVQQWLHETLSRRVTVTVSVCKRLSARVRVQKVLQGLGQGQEKVGDASRVAVGTWQEDRAV